MFLDQNHLKAIQDPKNIHDWSLFVPEGITTNPKKDLDGMSIRSKYGRASSGS